MEKKKKWWKIPAGILCVFLLAVIGYVLYVILSYDRIEDHQVLAPAGRPSSDCLDADGEFTVVTQNCGFGAYSPDFTFVMDGGRQSWANDRETVVDDIDGLAEAAASFSPDFILFQEIDFDSTRSYHVDERAQMQAHFPDYAEVFAVNYHSAFLMYPFTQPHGASNSGILTFSRTGITSAERRSLEISTGFSKFLDLDRCYSIQRIPVENGKELVLINLHLSAYGTDAAQGNAQLEMLFDDMKKEYEQGNYVICGGDFNHDFTGNSIQTFNPGSDAEFSWCHPFPDAIIPEGFTKCTDYAEGMVASTRNTDIPYSEESFTVILDGFLVSDNVECRFVQNIDTGFLYTDHNPVVMRFVLH